MCAVSHRCLLILASLFWATGSIICGAVCLLTVAGPVPPDAKAVLGIYPSCRGCEDLPRWMWVRWAALGIGLVLGLLQGWLLMWRVLARREAERIGALSEPKTHMFFPPWRLLGLCILCPCCVQLQLHTAQFVVSALIFIGLLANVCVFLAIGSLRILTGSGLSDRLPSVVSRESSAGSRTVYASAPGGDAFFR